jgi:hypothetical protein
MIGFMATQYFYRAERHFRFGHRMHNWFSNIFMRLERLEKQVFKKSMEPPRGFTEDEE